MYIVVGFVVFQGMKQQLVVLCRGFLAVCSILGRYIKSIRFVFRYRGLEANLS